MKIVVIGATGTIGKAVVKLLKQRHQIITVSRSSGDYRADITNKASLEAALGAIGKVDAIVSVAGSAVFKPLAELTDADFERGSLRLVSYARPTKLFTAHESLFVAEVGALLSKPTTAIAESASGIMIIPIPIPPTVISTTKSRYGMPPSSVEP